MYYQGNSEIQADGLQTLYLMNPNYNAYSDTSQQSGNMLILNYQAGNGINFEHLPNGHQQQPQPQPQQHLVGVPLQTTGHLSIHSPHSGGGGGGGGGGSIAHLHQSLWSSLDCGNQENGNIRSGVVVASSSGGGGGGGQPEVSVAQLGYHHMPVVSPTRQGLSLSLSSQQPGFRPPHNINNQGGGGAVGGGSNFQASGGGACSSLSSNSFVLGSKYIKAAQELLDEVVSIAAKEIKGEITTEKKEEKTKTTNKESKTVLRGESSGVDETAAATMATELTAAQKQEIQMKKAKLIAMIDEVDQRYAQYHHQMQVVVSSFEQATGVGSARSYTQLALQTISKQFRCLKDAISAQIKAASKSLGEEEILEGKIHGGSRLKYVDQQLRQQRALQHFGMIQTNNVWRPQRGLPERAVSVLRAWLFEHFLHPYPKDSDKITLAKQTGLTRSQVSNWFINARVRLWKPMVEEMYTEEMKNQETINASESNKQDHSTSTKSSSPKDVMNMTMLPPNDDNNNNSNNAFSITSNHEKRKSPTDLAEISRFGLVSEKNPKRIRQEGDDHMQNMVPISSMISEDMMEVKYGEKESLNELGMGNGLIGPFSFGDLENFNQEFHGGGGGGGVSLTLGLPPSDQQNFFSNQSMDLRGSLEMGSSGQGSYDQRVHKHHHQGPPHHMNIGYNETLHFPNS